MECAMAEADAKVIMPRRNFLIRALGFTAAGATLSLPLVTVADAKSRIEHHVEGLKAALRDYYPPQVDVIFKSNWQPPEDVLGGRSSGCYIFMADLPWEQRRHLVEQERRAEQEQFLREFE